MEQEGTKTQTVLAPHRYPLAIWILGLGILCALLVSLRQLPPYYRAAVFVDHAEVLAAHGQDQSAIPYYAGALAIEPDSKRARMGIAIAYYRSGGDHQKALAALQGLTFDEDEWRKLAAVMPAADQQLFPVPED